MGKDLMEMDSRRQFCIERKSFEVVFNRDVVSITEKSNAVQVIVESEPGLVQWLLGKLKGVIAVDEDEPKLGYWEIGEER